MKHYYRAQWEWFCESPDRCYWRAPGGNNIGVVDLRSNTQSGKSGGTPEGFAVFAYEEPQVIVGAEYLGTDESVVADFIWTKLTVEADPTGITAPKPLTGKLGKEVELYLAGEKIKSEAFTDEHKQRTVDVFQADYRENADKHSKGTLQKWVGAKMKEIYGEMSDEKAELLVPAEHKKGSKLWKKPATVIGDTFADTDGVNLQAHTASGTGGGFAWSNVAGSNLEIQSNTLQMEGTGDGDRDYRADTDLSTDDMYAKATVGTLSSGFDCAVAVRFSSSARTHYQTEWGANFRRISKFVAGSHTVLTSDGSSNSAGDICEVRVSGSNIQAFRNGVQVLTNQTDTDITGHLRTGLSMYDDASTLDNFEAGDLSAIALDGAVVYTDASDTLSVTVAPNDNRMLIVCFGTYQGSDPSGVTYNGVAMTELIDSIGSYGESCSIWGLVAPDTGTHNVVITGESNYYGISAYSLANVEQTLPATKVEATGDSSTASLSITPTVNNCWIIDSLEMEAVPTMTTSSGVSDCVQEGDVYQHMASSHFIQGTAAAKTMSYSGSYGSRWNICAVVVKPYGSAGGIVVTSNFFHFF